MIDKKVTGFDLPRMRLNEKWDFQLYEWLKKMQNPQLFFSILQDDKGNLNLFHSGLTDELYALMQAALHRNIEVHDFMKLCFINVQKFRDGNMNEAFDMMTRAINYITIKNSKSLNL